jgi:hypothetical protein
VGVVYPRYTDGEYGDWLRRLDVVGIDDLITHSGHRTPENKNREETYNREALIRQSEMGGKNTEACGRCSMSSVVDMTDGRDPYGENRIEVDERELRVVSAHQIAASRLKNKIDRLAQRAIYGR